MHAVSMSDHGIYDHVLHEDIFLGVIGILECEKFSPFPASHLIDLGPPLIYPPSFVRHPCLPVTPCISVITSALCYGIDMRCASQMTQNFQRSKPHTEISSGIAHSISEPSSSMMKMSKERSPRRTAYSTSRTSYSRASLTTAHLMS